MIVIETFRRGPALSPDRADTRDQDRHLMTTMKSQLRTAG
jgi:hypothetical protein